MHSVPALGDWTVPTLSAALNGELLLLPSCMVVQRCCFLAVLFSGASYPPSALTRSTSKAGCADDHPCFYVLSNTRALDQPEAVERAELIGANLRAAANEVSGAHQRVSVVSRGDSTLRGHYPAETDALARGLGWREHTVLLAPFFKEGGRLTALDMHYVLGPDGDTLTVAAETEFAKDRAFGFNNSHLPSWVEEKTEGKISKDDVVSISLELIRKVARAALLR